MRIVIISAAMPIGITAALEAVEAVHEAAILNEQMLPCATPFYLEAQEERRKYELQSLFKEPIIQPNYGWYRKFEKKKF